MRDIGTFSNIFIAAKPVDFRKQAQGLNLIINEAFGADIRIEKSLFVFTNKRKKGIKLVYWDKNGIALWWKNLEKDHFRWPKSGETHFRIKPRELKWLLEGIDFSTLKIHQELK